VRVEKLTYPDLAIFKVCVCFFFPLAAAFFVVRAMVGFYLSSGENNQLIGAKKRLDAKPWQ
jgi:hypothetical protein